MGNAINLETLHSHPELIRSMKVPIVAKHILALCPDLVELCIGFKEGEGNVIARSFSTQSKTYFTKCWFCALQKRPQDMKRLFRTDYTKATWESINKDQFSRELKLALEPSGGIIGNLDSIDSQINKALIEKDRNLIRLYKHLPWGIRREINIIAFHDDSDVSERALEIREALKRMKSNGDLSETISDVKVIALPGLTEVPDEIEIFTGLTALSFQRDWNTEGLKRFPDLHLPNLERLSLKDNQVTSLPNFSHMPKLRILDLRGNRFEILPRFEKCPNLGVYFWLNPLKLLPVNLWESIPFTTFELNECILCLKRMKEAGEFRYTEELHKLGYLFNIREGIDIFGIAFLKYNRYIQAEHEAGRIKEPQYINPHAERACNSPITHPEILMAALVT